MVAGPLDEQATLLAKVAGDAQLAVAAYGRAMTSKVALLEQAELRNDEAAAAAGAAALQRYAALVVERHSAIGAALRTRRAAALAVALHAWQQWAALDVRDAPAAAGMQRTVDGLVALRDSVVVPPPSTADWLADVVE